MKKQHVFIGTVLAFILMSGSCKEIGPSIDLTITDASLLDTSFISSTVETPDAKVVLLEEMTGFNCVNCPSGHVKAKEAETAYPGQLVVVGLNDYTGDPHPKSSFDHRTQSSKDIIDNIIGGVSGYPSGVVDRTIFAGETKMEVSRFSWSTRIGERALLTPPANIDVESEWDDANQEAVVTVTVHYTSSLTEPQFLSVHVMEDSIVDYQNNGLTSNPDDDEYVNNHIQRTMLTPFNGVALTESIEPGRVFIKQFRLKVTPLWRANKLEVVALVHNGGTNAEVQQVAEAHIIP